MSKVRTWEEIEKAWEEMTYMSCKPDFSILSSNYITDENKSVKWNREQVEINNKNYKNKVKELNTRKNKRRDEILNDIYKYIQEEVGHGISLNSAIKIWNYAYEREHDYGIFDIKCCLDYVTDLISDILDEYNRG